MSPYLAVLVAYGALLALVGLALSRRTRGTADFFVAGRALSPLLLGSTMLAANIGAGSTIGVAEFAYRSGLSAWWWVGSAGIGSIILATSVGPRIWRLAKRLEYLTVGDFLEDRYRQSVRTTVAGLMAVGSLSALAAQLIGVAAILGWVAGTSRTVSCLLAGSVVAIYFTAGGLKGAAWINLLQLIVKGTGFILAVPFALSRVGGWSALRPPLEATVGNPQAYVSILGIGAGDASGYLIMLVPAFIISPGLLQKIYGARDERTVKLGVGIQGALLLVYGFLPVILGMCMASLQGNLEDPRMALPAVITQALPFWLGSLLLASLFSAELSSADAVIFMVSTSISRDLYQRILHPEVSEAGLLRIGRWASFLACSLGTVLSILIPSVLGALSIFYTLMVVALFFPVVLGLYSRFANSGSALLSLLIAIPATLIYSLLARGTGWGFITPAVFGISVSGLVFVSAWLKRPLKEPQSP